MPKNIILNILNLAIITETWRHISAFQQHIYCQRAKILLERYFSSKPRNQILKINWFLSLYCCISRLQKSAALNFLICMAKQTKRYIKSKITLSYSVNEIQKITSTKKISKTSFLQFIIDLHLFQKPDVIYLCFSDTFIFSVPKYFGNDTFHPNHDKNLRIESVFVIIVAFRKPEKVGHVD